MKISNKFIWIAISLLGAFALATLALSRGEHVNAIWLVLAAVCCYSVAFRFYSLFISKRVFELNDNRLTPAERHNDGLNYVPTNKWVLFGHHFAAIAGAGPLVGPILAAQMGYLPGTLWLIIGVILAGSVQDFMILFCSTRRNGQSLGQMAKRELGTVAGTITMLGTFGMMIIILSALALVVVKALTHSPWSTFTILATVPIAILMGIYMRFIRPGKIAEVSILGIVLLIFVIIYGGHVAQDPVLAPIFDMDGTGITILLITYTFISSILPVWLLLAPRDYLSTFLKIGVILGLAIAIIITMPDLRMPALTKFVDGTGPVFSGNLFPFLFITIACGAVSGFHALVASGTTPKLIEKESHIRMIGYGAMLMESFVGIMALICATVIDPGVYFAMNSPAAVIGDTVQQAHQVISQWGFVITPDVLETVARQVGENSILSRAGGAPTFAVGMVHILHLLFNNENMMAFWYHFAVLFEAMFILTALDAGTRSCRFIVQDLCGIVVKGMAQTNSWISVAIGSLISVAAWGFFVYQGVIDPLGGINNLWPLFGIGNQLLAAMALILGTAILFKMKKEKYAWVSIIPTVWLFVTSMYAGWQKIFSDNPSIGFLAQARRYSDALTQGQFLGVANTVEKMQTIIVGNQINTAVCAFFMIVIVVMLIASLGVIRKALASSKPSVQEDEIVLRTGVNHV